MSASGLQTTTGPIEVIETAVPTLKVMRLQKPELNVVRLALKGRRSYFCFLTTHTFLILRIAYIRDS
jgi:hypothetical protein